MADMYQWRPMATDSQYQQQNGYMNTPAPVQPGQNASGVGNADEPTYRLPYDWNTYSKMNTTDRPKADSWAQIQLPYEQLEQNSRQYQFDFNESQRRWDAQYGQTAANDSWNQGFANRQQTAAEWQAQQAANQWGQQFGHVQNQDALNYGLQAGGQELARAQFQYESAMGADQLALSRQRQAQEFGLAQQSLLQSAQQEAGRLGLSTQEMLNTDKYRTALNQIEQQRLAQEGQLAGRGLDIQQWREQQQVAYQQQQLAQARELEMARLAIAQEQARYATFGRSQAPNAKWLRQS
jgi:hypothetical protein